MLEITVAVIVGLVTPQMENPVALPFVRFLQKHTTLEASETRLVAFSLAMLAARFVGSCLESGPAFWIIFGGALGYCTTRFAVAVRAITDVRNNCLTVCVRCNAALQRYRVLRCSIWCRNHFKELNNY